MLKFYISIAITIMMLFSTISMAQTTLMVTFLPSDIDVNPVTDQIILSSMSDGQVYEVGADGQVTAILEESDLANVISMSVDSAQTRLYVVNLDFEEMLANLPAGIAPPNAGEGSLGDMMNGGLPAMFGGQLPEGVSPPPAMLAQLRIPSQLVIFDLTSGQRLLSVDLTAIPNVGGGLITDVTVGADGTAYISDTLSGGIYSVDLNGNIQVLTVGELNAEGIGMLPLVYHPDGYLLIANASNQSLHRFDLVTSTLSNVILDADISAMTQVLLKDNNTAIISSPAELYLISSNDGWINASVQEAMMLDLPTLGIVSKDGNIHALQSNSTSMEEVQTNNAIELSLQTVLSN